MRTPGTGTIERLPSGRYRPQLPGKGGRKLATVDTREEAERSLSIALHLIRTEGLREIEPGTTLGPYGRTVLLRRASEGYRNAARELTRWASRIEPTDLGRRAVEQITRADVVAFVRALSASRTKRGHRHARHTSRLLSRSVVLDCLRILRLALREAVDVAQIRKDDPTTGVKVARSVGRTHDAWTWLRPAEVVRLLEVGASATVERDRGGLARKAKGPDLSEPSSSRRCATNPGSAADAAPGQGNGPETMHTRARSVKVVPLVPPDDLRAAIVALYTGVREGELWMLHRCDVDLEAGRVVVRYGGRRGSSLLPTKGRRPRTLQLLAPALDALRDQLTPPHAVPRSLAIPGRVELPTNGLGNRCSPLSRCDSGYLTSHRGGTWGSEGRDVGRGRARRNRALCRQSTEGPLRVGTDELSSSHRRTRPGRKRMRR